jgi:hypothetical protein
MIFSFIIRSEIKEGRGHYETTAGKTGTTSNREGFASPPEVLIVFGVPCHLLRER